MKLAIGMITRDFVSEQILTEFLDNAEKYGHQIDSVIVAYSHRFEPKAAGRLRDRAASTFIRLNHYDRAEAELLRLGMPDEAAKPLLYCPLLEKNDLVPYGFNRNTVVIEALLSGVDVLFFIDTDVHPYVLRRDAESGVIVQEEIDFFGRHLQGIRQGADITTSDYSGYHILPPAQFPHMEELLYGLHKEALIPFWLDSKRHSCLTLQETAAPLSRPTGKVLGGNTAIRMEALSTVPAFFSPYYFSGDTPYIARGEDTLLGATAAQGGISCIDIDTLIFHDTYGDFPAVPSLSDSPAVRSRLFYACTGWIGRNTFFRWKMGGMPAEESAERARQLRTGAHALAEYTQDNRFRQLPEISEDAARFLPEMIRQYDETVHAWDCFIRRVTA